MKLIADLHTHTVLSGHAFGTVTENAAAAAARGLALLAITEHGPALPGAPSFIHFRCANLLPETSHGVGLLAGIEANIVGPAGELDLADEHRALQDLVLIGFHPHTPYADAGVAANTRALLAAMARPDVDVVAHADNPHFPVELAAVVRAARERHLLVELNNRSFICARAGAGRDRLVALATLCRDHQLPLVVTSDAHSPQQVGCFSHGVALLAELGIGPELVLNADLGRLRAWLAPRHPRRRPKERVS